MREPLSEIPLNEDILNQTPPETIELLLSLLKRLAELEAENAELKKRIVELETRLNKNSSNSDKPPSSDSPFTNKPKKISQEEEKPKQKRKGYTRQRLEPTTTTHIMPGACSCGCTSHGETKPYYTHQVVELPEIELLVEDIVLHQGQCSECGKVVKAHLPDEKRTGYGPLMSALVIELVGVHGDSKRGVQDFLESVFGLPISQGAIQKIINRATEAIEPHYDAIGEAARTAPVNYIDETTWKTKGFIRWLWTMTNAFVAFFMIHKKRSKEAFNALIGARQGILVSDGYVVYKKWVNKRQSCLAHLIRRAIGVSEHRDPDIAKIGSLITKELRLLCHMAKVTPSEEEWNDFYQRLMHLFKVRKRTR
jgi:transposase